MYAAAIDNTITAVFQCLSAISVKGFFIHRMKKGKPITTTTLYTLCFILDCNLSDILVYVADIEEDLN